MHIQQLSLQRFRGAKSLELNLDERLNVFVGMNGAGKSSLLDASAILLSWMVTRMKGTKGSGRPITKQDINNDSSSTSLRITVKNQSSDDTSWTLAKTKPGFSEAGERTDLQELNAWSKIIHQQMTAEEGKMNLPLLAYYPVNRAVLDIPLRIRSKHQFDIFSAYSDSLTDGASFRTFFEWFREREDIENENFKLHSILDNIPYPDKQLTAVRRALELFMPNFKNLTVRRSPLRMEVTKNGEQLTVNQLSDGEKCLMALIGDITRRLAICNPELENPLLGDGIILIDEIDMHLHPKWQGMVVSKLLEVFKNCQFLVSTHSPHVLTRVHAENIFLLHDTENGMKAVHPDASYGKTANRILEDLMGLETTRPSQVNVDLKNLYDLIESGNLEKAKAELASLTQDIGHDPELSKAAVLIKRKEIIGK